MRNAFWLHALVTAGAAGVAAVFASTALRTPEIWPFLPRAPMELAVKLLGARNQEQVADGEFLGLWAFGFVVALGLAYLARALLWPKQRP